LTPFSVWCEGFLGMMFLWAELTDGVWYRMATNRLITIAIITVLVLLIVAVIVSKFR
jgi:hypothetical protein